jgi:hypothetical protein
VGAEARLAPQRLTLEIFGSLTRLISDTDELYRAQCAHGDARHGIRPGPHQHHHSPPGNPRNIPLDAHAQLQLEVGTPLIAPVTITFPSGV